LIGVSDYQATGLPSLQGVENDIRLMETLLKSDRFGFAENTTVLLNESATHLSLQREFENLQARIEPGDIVYIHYSGHGSYTGDLNGDEPSGQDQTWVSYGSRREGAEGVDAYDILDDELNQWLAPIFAKAGQVIVVADSCHSGSVTRGATTVVRAAPLDARDHPLGVKQFPFVDLSNGIIIGSARDGESAGEFTSNEGVSYGIFTWFWGSALEGAKEGETWRDLFERAAVQVNLQRKAQMPQLKGQQIDQAVFGGDIQGLPPRIVVKSVDAASQLASLPVGSLAGVTKGSIYRLYDPSAKVKDALPTLEITTVKPFYCFARITGEFKSGDLVIEESHAYTLEPIPVFINSDFPQQQDSEIVTTLRNDLRSGAFKGYRLAEDQMSSQMVLYVVRPKTVAVPPETGTVLPQSVAEMNPEVWVLNDSGSLLHQDLRFPMVDTSSRKKLSEALAKLAKVREVTNLSSGTIPEFKIKAAVWRPVNLCQEETSDCLHLPDADLFFSLQREVDIQELAQNPPRINEFLTFTLHNIGQKDYYAYLIDIGPTGEIFSVFPASSARSDDALVRAGQQYDTREEAGLVASDAGMETLKLLVSLKPINISLLEQDGLTRTAATRGELNPLENLLADAINGTRGTPVRIGKKEWGTQSYSFTVK
jgi:hypothetical protein